MLQNLAVLVAISVNEDPYLNSSPALSPCLRMLANQLQVIVWVFFVNSLTVYRGPFSPSARGWYILARVVAEEMREVIDDFTFEV